MKRRGLGTGLLGQGRGSNVLDLLPALAATPEAGGESLRELPLTALEPSPYQPRTGFDEAKLEELAASVREHGVLEPVLVRPRPDYRFQLLAGQRRLEAARRAGLGTVPARVREADDLTATAIALTENLAREDLSPLDEARGLAQLRDTLRQAGRKATIDELARLTGRSRGAISESLQIADALTPERLRRAVKGDVQTLNELPKSVLIGVVRANSDAEIARQLRLATGEAVPERATTPRGMYAKPKTTARGRPPEPYALVRREDGRLSLELRKAPEELSPAKARDLLARLRPLIAALQRRAKAAH